MIPQCNCSKVNKQERIPNRTAISYTVPHDYKILNTKDKLKYLQHYELSYKQCGGVSKYTSIASVNLNPDYLTLENCSIDDFDGNSENDLAFSLKNSNDIYLDVTELM